ncbi:MAG: acyl-CoA synthetase [Janthinobacterium lividum]
MSTVPQIILDDRAVTRDKLLLRARRAARGLDSLGVQESDAIAMLLRNDFAFLEASQAAAALGAYAVPINWHGKPEEVLYVINDVKPKILVAHADLLVPLRDLLPADLQVITVPTPAGIQKHFKITPGAAEPLPGDTVWGAWADAFEPWNEPPRRSRATMIYTSGTTGKPKGVRRLAATPEESAAYIELLRQVYGFDDAVRAMVVGPMYHSSPNAYMRQALPVAETLVLSTKFDAEETLAFIERHRITHAVMVPTMFVRILKLPKQVRERYDVSSLKWVVHTGAPCPVDVKKAMMDWWGPVIYETYGGTEAGTATLCTPQEWLAHPGTVGKLTPGARMAIYGDNGEVLPEGEIGEIYMRVPAYADFTYLNNEAKRKEVERDGLVSCGDIGYVRDGFLYLCDRRADMVISGGVNIYPAEIEAALLQCPGVHDCAVFGIPDEDFGESLAAAIEVMPGQTLTAAEVKTFLEQHLAKYKVPRRIDFHATLPREDSGKIFKRRLRDPFWATAGRSI